MTSHVECTLLLCIKTDAVKCDGAYVIMHHFHWFFSKYILRNILDTRASKIRKILVRGRRYSTMSSSIVEQSSKKYNTGM